MRYAIARTVGLPETTIDFYMGAGSADETDAQRGTAHFLEHMAFSGSDHFPPGTLLPRFEEIGVGLGRDQNAQTGLTGTTFSLDISDAGDDKVDLAFDWLRDVAEGLSIAPSEVDRERGTILSEYRESLSPASEISKRAGTFMFPELLGSRRLPIGTLATINSANADSIRAFWRKWYRPERAILIVVSDQPGDVVRRRIERTFGSWADETPASPQPNLGRIDAARGLDVTTVTSADVPGQLQVCRARDKDPEHVEDVAIHMVDLEDQIWAAVLTKRLDRLAQTTRPPIVAGAASRDTVYDTASLACVQANVRDGDWRTALRTVSDETRRMALYGLTAQEMDVDQGRASRQARRRIGRRQQHDAEVSRRPDPRQFPARRDDRHGRGGLSHRHHCARPADAGSGRTPSSAALGPDGNGPLLFLITPTPVAAADIRKAWQAAQASDKPAPPTDRVSHPWAYTDFGPPGLIVHREVLGDIGAVRVEFANGVRVNFKSVDNMPDKVFIRIRFGAGQQELPAGTHRSPPNSGRRCWARAAWERTTSMMSPSSARRTPATCIWGSAATVSCSTARRGSPTSMSSWSCSPHISPIRRFAPTSTRSCQRRCARPTASSRSTRMPPRPEPCRMRSSPRA